VRGSRFLNTVLVLWIIAWVCFGILITVYDVESKNKTAAIEECQQQNGREISL
jgi:hypothetical protein